MRRAAHKGNTGNTLGLRESGGIKLIMWVWGNSFLMSPLWFIQKNCIRFFVFRRSLKTYSEKLVHANTDKQQDPFPFVMLRKSMRIHYFVYRNNYICAVHATQMMVEKGSGLIVNISSFGGLRYTFNVAYGTGKSAVIPNQQLQCWGMQALMSLFWGIFFHFFCSAEIQLEVLAKS